MAALLLSFFADAAGSALVRELIFQVAAGATAYIARIVASWWGVGRPDGIESMVFARLRGAAAKG